MLSLARTQFFRYLVVSVVALLADIAVLYVLAVRLAVNAPVAGAIAYAAGLVVHYVLAISRVFGFRRYEQRPATEFTLYALTGILGVCVSYLVLLGGQYAGASLWSAKSVAVAISFTLTYVARRWFLFSRDRSLPQAAIR
ncbi:MAG: GtrA family protein [Casimicrobiaceae bacterium]